MNKNDYLKELEKRLLKEKINNPYSILRDVSNDIDKMIMKGKTMEDALKEVGSIDDIIAKSQPKTFENDDKVYEDKKPLDDDMKCYNDQFSESVFSSKRKEYSNKQVNSNFLNVILYILIGIIILSFIGRFAFFGFFSPHFGMGYFNYFTRNFFSFVIAVLLVIVIVKLLKNKKN
ncbi:MAG: hypothetical protein RR543_01035 [Erysipelotrichales bacterium]